jgi:hypothetical protein
VFPAITAPGLERLSCAGLIADTRNAFFAVEGGHVFFVASPEAGTCDAFANFVAGARGRYALDAIREALGWLFLRSEFIRANVRIPLKDSAAKYIAARAGFSNEFFRMAGSDWLTFWTLDYDRWFADSDRLAEIGAQFVARLRAESERSGRLPGPLPDACVYSRAGALFEMLRAGQLQKGVFLYNRFAVLAGLPPIAFVSQKPPMIDTPEGLLLITGDTFKMVKTH